MFYTVNYFINLRALRSKYKTVFSKNIKSYKLENFDNSRYSTPSFFLLFYEIAIKITSVF